jgi:hypothetical protein
MLIQTMNTTARTALFTLATAGALLSQALPSGKSTNTYLGLLPYPFGIEKQIQALGSRIKTPGQERVTYTARYTDPNGATNSVAITQQLPNLVRLDVSGPSTSSLLFDGGQASSSKGSLAQAEQVLLECFAMDTGEAFLSQMHNTARLRKLGEGFPLPGITGATYDVFEVEAPQQTASDKHRTIKHYWFDHVTGLLARVQHFDGAPGTPAVATVISGWTTTNGQPVPGKIESYEGTKVAHSFAISGATFAPSGSENDFKLP